MNATQINQYINHDELCACRRWVRNTRPACDCGASEAHETVRRAVNSHEAAQRLAEAVAKKCPYHHLPLLNGWAHSINRDTGLMGDKKTVRCTIPEEERAALAEWEAVK